MVHTTKDFLSLLNPGDGAVFLGTERGDTGYRQSKYNTLDEAIAAAEKFSNSQDTSVWFSLASFNDTSSRKATNAKSIKTLFIDVDCGEGKPFPTQKEGLRSLIAFVNKLKLPTPFIVDSGKGLHAYWIFDKPVNPKSWSKLAHSLKSQFPEAAWMCDGTLTTGPVFDTLPTADVARVSRVVGSTNPKTGKLVTVLREAAPVEYAKMAELLTPYIKKDAQPKHKSAEQQLLASLGNIYGEGPPANGDLVAKKCQQIEWCVNNQNDVTEPMWYAMMGIAAYCEEPEATAVKWSEKHRDFSPEATVAKMQQWKDQTDGPATCSKFEGLNPSGCDGCPFKDKISTPLRVGVRSKEVAPPQEAAHEMASRVPLPKGFRRTERGIVVLQDDIEMEVCPFDIYAVDYGTKEGVDHELAWFRWKRKNVGWCELEMRISHLVSMGDKTVNKEFMASIADQGIIMDSATQAMRFQVLLRNYIKELQERQTLIQQFSTFGWKGKDFVLGDTLIRANGERKDLAPSDVVLTKRKEAQDMYYSKGSLDRWVAYQKVIESFGLTYVNFCLLIGFASPLCAPAGVRGTTIHLHGRTGAGKTLGQKIQLSIYGDPSKTILTSYTTDAAFIEVLASRNSLPVCLDEATVLKQEQIGNLLYWVEQGTNKNRLTRTGALREPKKWNTLVTTSANRPFSEALGTGGYTHEAQLARLVELKVYENPHLSKTSEGGRALYKTYTENFGLAGDKYIVELVKRGEDVLRAEFEEARAALRTELGLEFTGSERYHEDVFALAYLGGKIASELGLVVFDVKKVLNWGYNELVEMREDFAAQRWEPIDYVTNYLNSLGNTRVDILYTDNSTHVQSTPEYMPHDGIHARLELHKTKVNAVPDRGKLAFRRGPFRKWVTAKGGDRSMIEKELARDGVLVDASTKGYLGKGTNLKVAQDYLIEFDVAASPELEGLLTNHEGSLMEKKLKVIDGGKA